jgi:hypothetical protein
MKTPNKSKQSVKLKNKQLKNKVTSKNSRKNSAQDQGTAPKLKASVVPSKIKAKSKSGKKAKERTDGEDVILEADDDFGAEEIPDLSEFDESQEPSEVDAENTENAETLTANSTTPSDEVVLTDAEGRRYCRVRDCDQVALVEGYCRFHYLALWKKIQIRRKILTDGKLERYVDELTSRYPDKFTAFAIF